jgi:hypothetical protein
MPKISAHQQTSSSGKTLNRNNLTLGILVEVTLLVTIGSFLLFTSRSEEGNWKTFRSFREVKISFEYPTDWEVVKSAGSTAPILIPKDRSSIGVTVYCYAKSSDKIIAWLASHENLISSEQISINGYTARKIRTQGRSGGERIELLIKDVGCSRKTQTLRLTMFSNQTISTKYESYFDRIVSSFNFTD